MRWAGWRRWAHEEPPNLGRAMHVPCFSIVNTSPYLIFVVFFFHCKFAIGINLWSSIYLVSFLTCMYKDTAQIIDYWHQLMEKKASCFWFWSLICFFHCSLVLTRLFWFKAFLFLHFAYHQQTPKYYSHFNTLLSQPLKFSSWSDIHSFF